MNTALNRTSIMLLTNKSGGSVAQGDVVIVDSTTAASFTTTTTAAYVSGSVGVVLEPNGIASNAIGSVAFGGYVPIVNLSGSASLGDVFKTHSVAKQAVRHAGPVVTGDFGQVLGTGTTPAAQLWGQPSGGGGAATTPTTLLDFAKTSDTSALSVPATTWTDVEANQSFTVGSASSLVEIVLKSSGFIQTTGGLSLAIRLVIDSAGTPINKLVGGAQTPTGTTNNSPFSGLGPVYLSGLSAAAHTVKVQAYSSGTGSNYYCRPTTNPDFEFLILQVIEHK